MMGHVRYLIFKYYNAFCIYLQDGNTPLHRAVVDASENVIQSLLNCPTIDVNLKNSVS